MKNFFITYGDNTFLVIGIDFNEERFICVDMNMNFCFANMNESTFKEFYR